MPPEWRVIPGAIFLGELIPKKRRLAPQRGMYHARSEPFAYPANQTALFGRGLLFKRDVNPLYLAHFDGARLLVLKDDVAGQLPFHTRPS